MEWLVKINIQLKESILDPQGQAVQAGLNALGYDNVSELNVGKYMELKISDLEDKEQVDKQVDEMCQRLLANPVIEDYRYSIEEMA
ncbi:phosphoribosylformylglycinamidine synthase subunit PurS [Halanaerobiaceae bacterium Z-7014]|uniref:Phosphoribosylformylglycinamidine synthase subunit PurS n=1 Tax=Halonatronomonas betaini TaxID=2778430 RepID=A0A931AVE5_9FIRM|nr:phosphoribosylformylglycinamidine synthase subunit PurS [Halonatronomonas betaini]MBF8436846.1 phosphoribosylformylglycinamidine synthase subunit PurS [Halonatronomonas betaini]